MKEKNYYDQEQLRYLKLLAKQYPTVQAASAEIIRLEHRAEADSAAVH